MSQKRQIFKLNILKKLLNDENSCVSLMPSTRLLALPPFFLTDMKSGILYLLNSMLKKYDRSLGGIVIGYQNIKVLMDENTGIIPIGTSEMEVNVSVEFYIFQPKIGSYLEGEYCYKTVYISLGQGNGKGFKLKLPLLGIFFRSPAICHNLFPYTIYFKLGFTGVVNKKSNTHIGCLVHQYFNATILKPEDVLFEDWICKDFNVDDKIIFEVIDLDFTTLLPYIEGMYDGRLSLDKVVSKSSENCDTDSTVANNNVNKNHKNEDSFSKEVLACTTKSGQISEDDFLDVTKVKNKYSKNKGNVKNNLEESRSFTDTGIKGKEAKEKFSHSGINGNEEKSSNDKESDFDKTNTKTQDDERKKKKKRNKDESNEQESLPEGKNPDKNLENSTLLPSHIHEKLLQVEDEDSNDFVKFSKNKKEKKRKTKNEESLPSLNKTNECLSQEEVEDNILYSTQLEPVGGKKMRISFCSPIPQSTPFEGKAFSKSTTSSVHINKQHNVDATEKETKKKHKKRKREKQDEVEDSPAPKKMKIANSTLSKKEEPKSEVNGDEQRSIMQRMVQQLCQEQLNRVKEELNMSSSDKEEKKKKEKKKKKREKEQNESVEDNNPKYLLSGEDGKSELQTTLNEIFRKELQKVKEQLSMLSKESFMASRKKKEKVKKEEKEIPKQESSKVKKSESVNEKKCDVKNTVDELCKQQLNRVKEELSMSHTSKEKKKKSLTNNEEASKERTRYSLYDKLLNDVKSSMEKPTGPILPPPGESGRKKKDSELSDVSTSSSKKKKDKHKKTEDCRLPASKFKNGSMYDVVPTPEKINPDKSLFSDSEQSHASPVKKRKEINGVEVESGKSKVQNMLDEFYREEAKRLKTESDRENPKDSGKVSKKKRSTEGKSQAPSGEEESLYEKLLKQAKSSIDVRDLSLPPKKEKKAKKNKKTMQDCAKS